MVRWGVLFYNTSRRLPFRNITGGSCEEGHCLAVSGPCAVSIRCPNIGPLGHVYRTFIHFANNSDRLWQPWGDGTIRRGGSLGNDSGKRVSGPEAVALVRREEPSPQISEILRSWPVTFDTSRARELGFVEDQGFLDTVRDFAATLDRK